MFDCCRVPGLSGMDWSVSYSVPENRGIYGHIVVLRKGGRIAEMGTHAELLKRGEVYAALYESQQRAAELAVTAEP